MLDGVVRELVRRLPCARDVLGETGAGVPQTSRGGHPTYGVHPTYLCRSVLCQIVERTEQAPWFIDVFIQNGPANPL